MGGCMRWIESLPKFVCWSPNFQCYCISGKDAIEVKWYYKWKSESESHSVMSNSLWPHGLYSSWNSPGQNRGMGSLSLLQGIFPTQRSNPGLPHCRRILYQLSHKVRPRILEWVDYPFPRGSSWIFLTQESNWALLHCRHILYQLSYLGPSSDRPNVFIKEEETPALTLPCYAQSRDHVRTQPEDGHL